VVIAGVAVPKVEHTHSGINAKVHAQAANSLAILPEFWVVGKLDRIEGPC
jgi:hypothetical protein